VPAQGIDTSEGNPAGKLQLHILCGVAEFEREIIRERVNAGLGAAKRKGVRLGRPAILDAYRDDIARLRAAGSDVSGNREGIRRSAWQCLPGFSRP
jgi:DNA invertase Pin-like site-specific DNA recombinase